MRIIIKILPIVFLFFSCSKEENITEKYFSNTDSSAKLQNEKFEFSLRAVGDIMLGSGFPNDSYLAPNNGRNLLDAAIPFIKSADIAFANLEGAILDSGNSLKECSGVCYYFRMKEIAGKIISDAGFDVLNLANNHANDFGYPGLLNTQRVLERNNLKHFGSLENPFVIMSVKGKKIGFLGFATSFNTLNMNNIEFSREQVIKFKSKVDILIVSFHGGGEGSKFKNITKETEIFLETKRGNPYAFAHAMIDAGADVIIGHGPHVPRAVEIYKDKLIVYSLGNFCTYRQFSLAGSNKLAPMLDAKFDSLGKVLSFNIISFIQISPGIPKLDKLQQAKKEILRLSQIDFPETGAHKIISK